MIGILGGTFDPIHYGHLRTALEVSQGLGLKEIRFIPLRHPPHRERPHSSPHQRLAMAEMATATEPAFRVDQRELRRNGRSYTVDTLHSLRRELGDQPLCLLLGSDAFRGFRDWHQPELILEMAHIVVMQRPGEGSPAHYAERVVESADPMRSLPGGHILFQPVTQLQISSTAIREMLRTGRSPKYLLPDPVLAFIQEQGLYKAR
jgi:nicotinate-nucleotide adenylyltransferase